MSEEPSEYCIDPTIPVIAQMHEQFGLHEEFGLEIMSQRQKIHLVGEIAISLRGAFWPWKGSSKFKELCTRVVKELKEEDLLALMNILVDQIGGEIERGTN